MKNNSLRKAQDSLFNISSQPLEQEKTFQKVRSSVALFGLALSIGSAGILLNQSDNQSVDAAPLPKQDRSSLRSANSDLDSKNGSKVAFSDRLDRIVTEVEAIAKPTKSGAIFDLQNLNFKIDEQAQSQSAKPPESVPQSISETESFDLSETELTPTPTANQTVKTERQLLDQIVAQLKSGQSIEAVAEQYRHITKVVPEAIAEGKIVPISYRRYRQDRLGGQITKQPKHSTYQIAKGDTLEAISVRTGISQSKLARLNRIQNPNLLVAGTLIKIPVAKGAYRSNYVARKSNKAPKEIATRLIQKFDNRGVKVATAQPFVQVVSPANLPQASERSLSEFERPFQETNFESTATKNRSTAGNNQSQSKPVAEKSQRIEKVAKLIPNSLISAPTLVEQPAIPTLPSIEKDRAIAKPNVSAPLPTQNLISEPVLKESVAKSNSDLSKIALLPKPSESLVIEQSQLEGKPMELPAIPEAETSISTAEIEAQKQAQADAQLKAQQSAQAISLENDQKNAQINPELSNSTRIAAANISPNLSVEIGRNDSAATEFRTEFAHPEPKPETVRSAEFKRSARKFERQPTKVAALNLQPAQVLQIDRNNNLVREPQVSPKLPALSAAAYLPQMANPSGGKIAESSFIWPAAGVLSSGFGWRWGRAHQGIDIAGPVGTPIVAAADGTVDFAGWNNGGYGYLVDIRHSDGTVTRYAHNSALYVRAGQSVNQGQAIAAMGSTGFSTGPHLHFEIRPNGGRAVNPIVYLARR